MIFFSYEVYQAIELAFDDLSFFAAEYVCVVELVLSFAHDFLFITLNASDSDSEAMVRMSYG
jgi:hypothetical protein